MHRCSPILAILAFAATGTTRADVFDAYTNPILARLVASPNVKEVKQLTTALIIDNDRVLPGSSGTFVVVKTNEGRYAKLLVQSARQRVDAERTVPELLIERHVTYTEGEEQARTASGRNLALFPGFRLNLDLGQIVPAELGGDLRFVVDGKKIYAEPLGKARLFLVTRALADVPPKKGPKRVIGATFDPSFFNGTYKLYDDGRRSGKLVLKVGDKGSIEGSYYSDKDGKKYPVKGKIGTPAHSLRFTIKFPRTEQTFHGFLFTGDARALAGSSQMLDREAGFYAVRVDE
jgi:hypothetical protein